MADIDIMNKDIRLRLRECLNRIYKDKGTITEREILRLAAMNGVGSK